MNSLALSGLFALSVILLALWLVAIINRAPPTATMVQAKYPGRDFDAFIKVWKRKLRWLTRRETDSWITPMRLR